MAKTTTLLDARLFIRDHATVEDISAIILSIKERQKSLAFAASMHFKAGDQVKFDARNRGIVYGKIESFARGGKATVVTQYGTQWRVAASLLQAV